MIAVEVDQVRAFVAIVAARALMDELAAWPSRSAPSRVRIRAVQPP
jgi:hypothetical protein